MTDPALTFDDIAPGDYVAVRWPASLADQDQGTGVPAVARAVRFMPRAKAGHNYADTPRGVWLMSKALGRPVRIGRQSFVRIAKKVQK